MPCGKMEAYSAAIYDLHAQIAVYFEMTAVKMIDRKSLKTFGSARSKNRCLSTPALPNRRAVIGG